VPKKYIDSKWWTNRSVTNKWIFVRSVYLQYSMSLQYPTATTWSNCWT